MKCPKLKKIKLQNGAVKLECLEDKGNDKYKVGCYIWGDLLSTKVLRVEKLEEWANSRKRGFSHDPQHHIKINRPSVIATCSKPICTGY